MKSSMKNRLWWPPQQPDMQASGVFSGADDEEKALVYDGVEYGTRKQMAEALDVDYLRLNAYLRKYDDVGEAVEKCLSGETSLSITYNDTMYRSFKAMCDTYKIAPALVRQVAAAHDSDRMDAFADLATLREVGKINEDITLTSVPFCILAGVPYKNHKDMAEQLEMEPYVLKMYTEDMGLVPALQHMQGMQTMAFHVDDGDEMVSMENIAGELANYPDEHIVLDREDVPQYPLLENIDIYMECYDVDAARDSIGTGEYAKEYQVEPERDFEQTM